MENSEGMDTIREKQAREAQKRHDAIYPLGVSQPGQLLSSGHLIESAKETATGIEVTGKVKRKSPKK